MNIPQYLFQSPSPSQVQIGRADPSTKNEETTNIETKKEEKKSTSAPQMKPVEVKTAGEILTGGSSTTNTVVPTVSSNYLLDVYA